MPHFLKFLNKGFLYFNYMHGFMASLHRIFKEWKNELLDDIIEQYEND